jgi:adenosylhomocysteinase
MNGRERINWAAQEMPVLASIRADFEARKPLIGMVIGACLHITKETAVLLETLQAGGATVFAAPSNPLSTQNDVAETLCLEKIQVYGMHGATPEQYHQGLLSVVKQHPRIVIDDGGDLTKFVHDQIIGEREQYTIGGLEETTTGVNVIKQMEKRGELRYPILDVNGANTKHFFDNVYGTGQSVIDAIMRSTNQLLAGKTFVVAGYGYCGKGLAQRARGMGCIVIVTEVDSVKALQALMDGFEVMKMDDAAYIGDIFITVTGDRDVITAQHMIHMKHRAVLANAGHFDVEINIEDAKKFPNLILLGEGRLVNLACAEGHPSSVMDMSFANQALGVEYLLNKYKGMKPGVHEMPREIDEKVARLKLEAFDVQIDELTQAQKEYLGL